MVLFIVIIIFISSLLLVFFLTKTRVKKPIEKKLTVDQSKYINPIYLIKNPNVTYNIHFFTDKKIILTGVFKNFSSRNELAKLLWKHGAVIDTKFNSNTDYLIVGNTAFDMAKIKNALYLNVKVITENEVLDYFSNSELNVLNTTPDLTIYN